MPPVSELAKKIVEEKKNQTNSQALKRKHEKDRKQRIDDTMLAFTDNILPAADGCHPSITIGATSNKIKRFDSFNRLQRGSGTTTDGETMITMPSMDDEYDNDDNNDDDDHDDNLGFQTPYNSRVGHSLLEHLVQVLYVIAIDLALKL